MPDARQRAYLEAMGIELWVASRASSPEPASADVVVPDEPVVSPPVPEPEPQPQPAREEPDWDALAQQVAECRKCGLCESRTQTVFGVGDHEARLMIIGEAPGADEDRLGEPFVGRAGQLLTAMLAAIGLTREQVYIANVLKCRPPGNRNPAVSEIAACRGYLNRQIALLRPDLILSLGGISAHSLLETQEPVGRLRARRHQEPVSGTGLRVTYHPAYLLRRPEEKAKAWSDLQQVWRDLQGGRDS